MYNLNYLSSRNKKQTESDILKNYYSSKKLKILEFKNSIIASRAFGGPGVFSSTGYIKESDFTNSVDEIRELKEGEIIENNEEVVFIGTLASIWGHCITDNLKHLWILLNESNLINNLKFAYVQFNENENIPDSFFKIIEFLGKKEDIIQIKGKQKYKKVYIPEQCFFCIPSGKLNQSGERFYTKEYIELINKIKMNVYADTTYEKVYFTRTLLRNQYRDFGEKDIEHTFSQLGYKIISPEKIALEKQISILKGCNTFATTQGSISLNSIFCNSKAHIIIINKQNYNTPYQLAVNHARGGEITIIDANKSILNPRHMPWIGPFFMYNSKELCDWANIKYKGIPIIKFVKYLFWGLLKKLKGILNRLL